MLLSGRLHPQRVGRWAFFSEGLNTSRCGDAVKALPSATAKATGRSSFPVTRTSPAEMPFCPLPRGASCRMFAALKDGPRSSPGVSAGDLPVNHRGPKQTCDLAETGVPTQGPPGHTGDTGTLSSLTSDLHTLHCCFPAVALE